MSEPGVSEELAPAPEPGSGPEQEPVAEQEPAAEQEPVAEPEPPPAWWTRLAPRMPLVLVGLTVVFNLWALHPNAYTTDFANDSSVHIAMARWANLRISQGHLPFDGWFPYLDLGSPRFHHYQALPAIMTGAIGTVTGTDGAFHWLTYLLIALWPICVFASVRLMGWGRWVAASAAVVSPLLVSHPSLGYEWSSYTWGGYGLYTQLWGMWFLPFSWALTWRAVSGRGRYWPAALVTALCIGAHLLTGYLALLTIGVWVLIKPSQFLRRVGRAALVGVGSVLGAAWMLVPLLVDERWTTQDPFSRGNAAYDSFGAPKVLGWLFSGAIFDNHRLPIVTVLAGIGMIVCIARFRRDERARMILGAFVLSLLLFFGRPTLGSVIKFLPGNGDLFLRRYVFGVHLAGIVLAGVGAVASARAIRWVVGRIRVPHSGRWRPVVAATAVAVIGLVVVVPGFTERAAYAARQFAWVAQQRDADHGDGADFRALVSKAESLGPGRLFSGQGAGWGHGYLVGFVPNDIGLLYGLTDAVGFNRPTWSLSSSVTHYFDSADPDQYRLFDVRYIIEPVDAQPLVPARRVEQRGRYVLWEVPDTHGYFEVVDAISPIQADRTDLGTRMQAFLKSSLIASRQYPTVAFSGATAAPATIPPGATPGSPGEVLSQSSDPENGRFGATVRMNRRAVLLLKESFDPRWRVTVDGKVVAPQMMAPSFLGVELGPGRHVVAVQYAPYPRYWLLFLISIASIVGLALLDRRRRRKALATPAPVPAPVSEPTLGDRLVAGERTLEHGPENGERTSEPGPEAGERTFEQGERISEQEPEPEADQPPASTAAPTAPE